MSQQDAPIPVTGPVTATVGPVWLDIRMQLASHGFEPPEFQIMKADPAPVRVTSTEVGPW